MTYERAPIDKASGRSRGFWESFFSFLKVQKFAGKVIAPYGTVLKHGAELRITDGGRLTLGFGCVVQSYALILLTKPAPELVIGDNVSIGRSTIISCKDKMVIGSNCLIAPFVHIADNMHSIDCEMPIAHQRSEIKPVTIGNDVWIGAGARIHPGVSIGNGAVVGSNSVVTKDVPPFTIVAGVPAKTISSR